MTIKLTDAELDTFADAATEYMVKLHHDHWNAATPLAKLPFRDWYNDYLPPSLLEKCKDHIRFRLDDNIPKPFGTLKALLDARKMPWQAPGGLTVGNLIFADKLETGFRKFQVCDSIHCHEMVHVLQYFMLGVWEPQHPDKINEAPTKAWAKVYISDLVTWANAGMNRKDYAKIRFESPAVTIQQHYLKNEDEEEKFKFPDPAVSARLAATVRGSLELMKLKIKN
jgi:hypothetical protein